MSGLAMPENARAPFSVRGHDPYANPPAAVHALVKAELHPISWEAAE